ncbi:MAG: hypothetical protein JXO44_14935 [Clostridia bacterium]|nr:hypothetical protein [Clostridia bacterium]
MRVALDRKEAELIIALLSSHNFSNQEDEEKRDAVSRKLTAAMQREIPQSKRAATKKAVKTKISTVKRKIENAVNLMLLEGKEITIARVAAESGVSYNTAAKYIHMYEGLMRHQKLQFPGGL